MKTKIPTFFIALFIIAWPVLLRSQINTTAVTVSDCPGDIVIPINVTNCNNVGAISLVLQYNTSVMTFLNFENTNPQLSSGTLIVNPSGSSLHIVWYSTTAANVGNGKLMDLRFSGITGSSTMTWDTQTPGNCEYSDIDGNILPSSYTNGTATIYQVPEVTSQPQDQAVLEYSNAGFLVGAIATGIEYQWFASSNGGIDWVELFNSSLYSGVKTANLTVYNVQLIYDGFLYRCEISGTCEPVAVSDPAELIVIEPLITSFNVDEVCPGTISIPILTSNFNNVAAFSLVFSYNESVLSFSGFEELNALIPPGNFVCNASGGKVYMTWSSTTPVTFSLPDTSLVEILFTGITGSSSLTWDTETLGSCEYTYLNSNKIVSVFVNNSFTIYQTPQITVQPVDKLIPENTATSFNVSAIASGINYQWQISTNEGGDWDDLSNGGIYSGVTSSQLNISNASLGMNGYWYRCVVGGYCTPDAVSDPGVLSVLPKITAIAPTVSDCPGPFVIPIDITHFIDVASFSLALNYNNAVLTYNGFQSLHSNLAGGNFTANASGGKVYMTWSSTTPVTIGDDQLVELLFTGAIGTSTLTWDTQTPGYCEFATLDGLIIFSNYTNGNVTVYQPPAITSHPTNKTAPAGTGTSFSVSATGTGLDYQWQVSTNNGLNWTNLLNGGSYSGVTSTTLQINPVLWSMDQNLYRCSVSGTCPPQVYSSNALLDVIPEVIYTVAGPLNNSCTGNITVPIGVTNCSNVSAISLTLNYDPAKLTYEGYESVNSALSGGMQIICNTGTQIKFSWVSVSPANIGSGTLVKYKFKTTAGISTVLDWDDQTPGNCEYSDPDGYIYVTSFTNGNISTAANALVVDAGDDKSIAPGGSVQLDGSATGGVSPYDIQWTPVTWLSNPEILTPLANPPASTNYLLTVTDDLGCSGSDQMTVEVITAGIDLNLKVFLEGPFETNDMRTDLNMQDKIPSSQPYSAPPWNYYGSETVTSIPDPEIVDWILVELRETSGSASTATSATMVGRQAGFVFSDGTILSEDGSSMMHFDISVTQNLYAVIWHRNHLSIMSSGPLTHIGPVYSWDFTTGSGQAHGTAAQKHLGGGYYGMYTGDINADGEVESTDISVTWKNQAGKSGYYSGDIDMNIQVNNQDKNGLWFPNRTIQTQVPD
ncbi:MAG: hypothetical protein JW731_09620 [Bacteroidales bacterium]|nr:hypothetical protein [Bacteroidales bacterium]